MYKWQEILEEIESEEAIGVFDTLNQLQKALLGYYLETSNVDEIVQDCYNRYLDSTFNFINNDLLNMCENRQEEIIQERINKSEVK